MFARCLFWFSFDNLQVLLLILQIQRDYTGQVHFHGSVVIDRLLISLMILPICPPFNPLRSPVHVLIVDGTSLQSIIKALLALCLVMFLDLPCSSFHLVRLLTLVVESFPTLTLVLIRIVTLVLALDVVTPSASWNLTGFTFPPLPPSQVPSPLLPQLPTLCGIIVLVTWICLWRCAFKLSGLTT